LIDHLRAARATQTGLLRELVRIPTDNPPGDMAAAAERVAALLEGLGLPVERHPVSPERAAAAGMVSCCNLIVRRRFGPGPTVALNAHADVVPPGDGWTYPPYAGEEHDGWLYGRGAAVSKSDIATYAFAMLALDHLEEPHGTVELHVTFDEESGGELGPKLILADRLSHPDFAICAGFSYGVTTSHNGALHLEVEVSGRSAHAARPQTGVDALEAATAILAALYGLRPELARHTSPIAGIGAPQINVGLIAGGTNTNVVPNRVTFRLDRRIVPEERAATVEADLRDVIAAAAAGFAATVVVRRILLAEPLTPLPGTGRLADLLCRHAGAAFGVPVRAGGVPLYTDARHYAAAGVPVALYGAGPRTIEEANAHRADERVRPSDMHRATEVIALTVRDLLHPAA